MNYGEAIASLEGYKQIHGSKLNAPWRKNPNLNLLGLIDHWLRLFAKKPAEQKVIGSVEKRVRELTKGAPAVARVGGVNLSRDEIDSLLAGEMIQREVVPGVVSRIRMRKGVEANG